VKFRNIEPERDVMKLKPLAKQVVVITGASSGIGLVTARLAAQRGAKVFLVSRNAVVLEAIVSEIRADGGVAEFAAADVGERSALSAAADKAIACFGRIDTWVNNAGVAIYALLLDTPDDEHERLFRTNYFGVVNGSKIAVEHLCEHGGALITVASIASDMPSPIMGAYSASKHASKAFTESLRIELQAAGVPISLTVIKPSGISTPIGAHAANHLDGEAKIPPPVYDPILVAEAILDSAVHSRREVTVGGAGRAQVLFAGHFPALFERLAPLLIPQLSTKAVPKTQSDNLESPASGGNERSPNERGRRLSLYTAASLRPVRVLGVLGVVVLAGGAIAFRNRLMGNLKEASG
jgi:short-subunit dehydrogenase